MSPESDFASIADASRPNAGRIYDYLLGGNHNFEIDRQAAERLKQMVPEMPQWIKLIRWFLGEAVRRLLKEGYRHFLDFASGLPTVDHIHQLAPAGTKVIYSDVDPVTVAYAKELVKDNDRVAYLECDVGKPEVLLNSPVIRELFGKQRKVAIGVSGIAWFLPDDRLSHAMKTLYEWAAPGSKLYINDLDTQALSDAKEGLLDFYKNVGQAIYPRPNEKLMELVAPWQVTGSGFRPLEEWVGMEKGSMEQAERTIGGGNILGGLLVKP